jgi:hypothetical protein
MAAAARRRVGRGVTVQGSAGTTAAPGGPEEEEEPRGRGRRRRRSWLSKSGMDLQNRIVIINHDLNLEVI